MQKRCCNESVAFCLSRAPNVFCRTKMQFCLFYLIYFVSSILELPFFCLVSTISDSQLPFFCSISDSQLPIFCFVSDSQLAIFPIRDKVKAVVHITIGCTDQTGETKTSLIGETEMAIGCPYHIFLFCLVSTVSDSIVISRGRANRY